VRIDQENDIEVLRRKAVVLERENERLASKITALLSENMKLSGEDPSQFELRLQALERELQALNA
jgi:transposase